MSPRNPPTINPATLQADAFYTSPRASLRPPVPSHFHALRESLLNFLFPFLVDAWLNDLILFYRRLGSLVKAGMPVSQALRSMQESTYNKRLRPVLKACARDIDDGDGLSAAMARHSNIFNELQVEIIHAGELSGHLHESIEQVADFLEKERELRRFLSKQTLYSKITLVIGVFFIPFFKALLTEGSIWNTIKGPLFFWIEIAVFGGVLFSVGRTWLARSEKVRLQYERFKWKLPGVGSVARKYALVKFTRTLGALCQAGIGLPTAYRVAGRASGSLIVAGIAEQAASSTEQGSTASPALQLSGVFPESTVNLLVTGEKTGNMDAMMFKAAEYLEEETDTKAHKVAYIFSNIVYLLVALYVAGLI